MLGAESSAQLRDQLLKEIRDLTGSEDLALWAHRRMGAKNKLTSDDARAVEDAYRPHLEARGVDITDPPEASVPLPETEMPTIKTATANGSAVLEQRRFVGVTVSPIRKEVRQRNKAHLPFVGTQACLVCQRSPCDAHHLKFAQPRALGRKVSDEFTVPLCRDHHLDLHRQGNEIAWWADLKITPIEVARDLWQKTLLDFDLSLGRGTLLQSIEDTGPNVPEQGAGGG